MSLKDQISSVIKGEVYDDQKSLDSVSRDASLFELHPQLLVAPIDAKDICSLVTYVSEHADEGLSLTPRSAGTDMSGGPLSESIVMDMKATH